MFKVGFIGVGNMGGALASSVAKIEDVSSVFLANRSSEKAKVLKEKIGEKARISTNIEAAQECDFIFLGVKPNVISNVLSEISEVLSTRHKNGETFVLVSMAAGVTLDKINQFAGVIPTIRIMPNTPVSIGEGVTLMCNKGVEEKFLDDFKTIMQKTGNVFELEEELMDAGTALSGCGPAFVYMFADAIASGGEKLGIDAQLSKELALSTIIGSSKLAYSKFDETLESLKDAVCSPGGATLKGVEVLDRASFATIAEDAIQAACKRSKELAEA
jgi:pyrroline-5-carboxylate reductase